MNVNHNRNQKVEPVHINSKYLEPARYWVINDHMINDHVVEKYFPKKQYFLEDHFRITEISYFILKQTKAPLWKKIGYIKFPGPQ